jgi:IS30 family transposase
MAHHLTLQDRDFLDRLLKKGVSKAEIAELMGRDRSTIYRELRRNARRDGYRPERAQRLADNRRRRCRRSRKLDDDATREYVRERLEKRWSPDQIAGRSRRDFPRQPSLWLSRQTIYAWIHEKSPRWQAWLRRGGKPPEKRGKLTDCVRIDGRPEVINRRRSYGDRPPMIIIDG